MGSQVLDVLSLIPDTLEKVIMFPSTANSRAHHGEIGTPEHRGSSLSHIAFPVDITESSDEYTFFVDVPGLSKSDLQVTVEEERNLVIKSVSGGKRKRDLESEEEGCKYLRLERRRVLSQKLMRKFRLPEDADVSAVSAKCENGVLTVSVKKVPPPPKPKAKTVQISVA